MRCLDLIGGEAKGLSRKPRGAWNGKVALEIVGLWILHCCNL